MKHLNNYIIEKLKISSSSKINNYEVKNKIDLKKLKYFTEKDIDIIINWINNDMSSDIRPIVITNERKNIDACEPSYEVFLLYNEDYEKYNAYDIPYIRFFYDEEGLSIDIYDHKEKTYIRSKVYKNTNKLDECFNFIEGKHDTIKELI